MKPYTYLLIDFFTVVVCFVASFDKRIEFYKHFGSFLKAATLAAIPFIAWDVWFTHVGVWWFHHDYTTGITLFNLPIEECLFFFCIPFSCVFTFFCVEKFFNLDKVSRVGNIVSALCAMLCVVVALLFYTKWYPFITACSTLVVLVYVHFVARVAWLGKATVVYGILLPGFFLVNGILTGTGLQSPIVNYNPDEILTIRMGTIPVEDMVYGYAEFILVWFLFQKFKRDEK